MTTMITPRAPFNTIVFPLAALAALTALAACSRDSPVDGDRAAPVFDGIAADETVRFTGTEPFWGGEVTGDTLLYSTPENIDGENIDGERIAVERFAGLGGVSWSGELGGLAFDLALTEGDCSDGMSDRTYPFVVTLSVRGETRRGCAWSEQRPFSGDPTP